MVPQTEGLCIKQIFLLRLINDQKINDQKIYKLVKKIRKNLRKTIFKKFKWVWYALYRPLGPFLNNLSQISLSGSCVTFSQDTLEGWSFYPIFLFSIFCCFGGDLSSPNKNKLHACLKSIQVSLHITLFLVDRNFPLVALRFSHCWTFYVSVVLLGTLCKLMNYAKQNWTNFATNVFYTVIQKI